jgi:hypothetical protein
MRNYRIQLFCYGFFGAIFLWGRGFAPFNHSSMPMTVSEPLSAADSLTVIDSLRTSEAPIDSADRISADTAEMKVTEYQYSTDWSWLSMGEVCFADSVIHYDPGAPGADTGDEPDPLFKNASLCLGPPDQLDNTLASVSLGSGGTLILEFTDNVFFDQPGPDLYFWMPDHQPEEAQVWISRDGAVFQNVGTVSSESPFLDISGAAKPGDFYTVLKIRDNPFQGDSNSPSL